MGIRFLPVAVVAAGLGFVGPVQPSLSASITHAVMGGDVKTSLVQEVQSSRDYRSNRNRDRNYRYNRGDRTYSRHRHGPRYHYRHGRYRHYHDGYYYANPWWLVPGIIGLGMSSSLASRCSYWRDRCIDNWGYGGSNYYGCMRYYNC